MTCSGPASTSPNKYIRTIAYISVLTFLLVAASSLCFAEIVIVDVSTNRAKELGVTIRTNMNGQAGIQVEMEFKTVGELKKITYAELQIGDGENRIMSAPLLASYPSPDRATVRFSAYPAYVPKSTLMIAVYGGLKGDVGYRFKVKDFIEHEGPAPIIDRAAEAEAKAKREPKALAAEALTPADLLKVLRGKDAQFDNAKLDYARTGEHRAKPFPAWKYPEIAKQYGWEKEKPEIIPFRYNESLIVRGPSVAFIRILDPTYPEKKSESTRHMLPYQKWSNVGGVRHQITRNAESGPGHAMMDINPGGAPVDMAQEQAMEVEFVNGFGFGKRIKQVDRIERDGPRLKVEGTIQIWWEDISRFQLVLGDHFLVRQAAIQSNVKGYRTDFEVKTEGSVTAEGFEFAKSGSFKRISLGMEAEGKLTTKPRILKEFQAEFKGVQFHLSDARYEELVAMIPDPGTQVFDHVSDKVYFVGEEEKARPLLPPPDAPEKKVRAQDSAEPEAVEKTNDAAAGPGEREQTPPIVSSRQEADRMLGKRVAVVGEARTGKTPNVSVTFDFYVECHGDFRWQGALTKPVLYWPESFVGEKVKVIGRIEKVYLGGTNSVPIRESNCGYRLWDVVYEVAKPQPTRSHMTCQEILAGRAAPDLKRLAERSAPSVKGTDATESFWDILKLREAGDKEAIPVLEKILLDNLETTRTHGFAAAQALFCIDPAGTSHLLSRHLLAGQYQASLAFNYTAHWEMQEPQRNRFINQYLLQNVSTNLALELTAETTTNTGRLNFVLTLRNASEMPLQIPDRTVYLGQHLFFRERLGQFARSGETVTYEPPMQRWIELGPGRTHRLQIQTVVKPAGEVRSARHLISPQAAVVLITGDYLFDIGKPGSFQVMAMFEDHGTGKGHWEGRVVSKPVRIAIPGAPAEK